ncbi:lipopolysaccharide biosynthesis protein [Pannonibacter carbonis]|uniref:lipopolysaccharide biosynthesis protein n=1 Tax=Pannonibacter carbonis TaxID=2067569 RepID=UPI000D0FFCCF|nr:oligosaccharide flippase family protein [Pannonibacter carbonis]
MIGNLGLKLRTLAGRPITSALKRSAAGQLLLVVLSPLLARLYTPEDFGTYGLYSNVLGVLVVVASMRLELAIPSAQSNRDATLYVMFSLLSSLIFSVLFIIALSIYSCVFTIYRTDILYYGWVIPLSILVSGPANCLIAWSLHHRQSRSVGKIFLLQSIQTATIQVISPLFVNGPIGLLISLTFGPAGGLFHAGTMWVKRLRRIDLSIDLMRNTFLKIWHFPVYAVPASLIARMAVHAPVPILFGLYGAEFAGLVILAQRVIGLPTALFGRVAASFFQQYLGNSLKKKHDATKGILGITFLLGSIGGITMIVTIIFAPDFFSLTFGTSWRSAGEAAQILAPMYCMQLVAAPLSQAQIIAHRMSGQIKVEIIRLLIVCLSIFVPNYFEYSPYYVLGTYSIGMTLVYALYVLAAFRSARTL